MNLTAKLYGEMEVMGELEQTIKKFQRVQYEESRRAFEQKLVCQKQNVRLLKDISLWNQTYDKVVELLARTVCTLYVRICHVFGRPVMRGEFASGAMSGAQFHSNRTSAHLKEECVMKSGQINVLFGNPCPISRALSKTYSYNHSGVIEKGSEDKRELNLRPQVASQHGDVALFRDGNHFACGFGPGRLLLECLSVSSSASKVDDDDDDSVGPDDRNIQVSGCCGIASGVKRGNPNQSSCFSRSIITNGLIVLINQIFSFPCRCTVVKIIIRVTINTEFVFVVYININNDINKFRKLYIVIISKNLKTNAQLQIQQLIRFF